MKNKQTAGKIKALIIQGDAFVGDLDFSQAIDTYEKVLRLTRGDTYKTEREETDKKIENCELLKERYKVFEPKIRDHFQAEVDTIKNTIVNKESAFADSEKEIAEIESSLQNKVNQIDQIYKKYPLLKNAANTNSPNDFSEHFQVHLDMVFIKGGAFTMGKGDGYWEQEGFTREVTLSDYYIGKYPVTQEQWEIIMGNNPNRRKGKRLPVASVSWAEIQEFIEKLNQQTEKNYQLPTEAQWEYAARGGEDFKYPGSDDVDEVAWIYEHNNLQFYKSQPVGLKKANGFGLYDMSGNIEEFCNDWYEDYKVQSAQTDPQGPNNGSKRVMRGGMQRDYCQVYYRTSNDVDGHYHYGFRLALIPV